MGHQPSIEDVVLSILKARGVHDPAVRRVVLEHCRRGHLELMTRVTATFLTFEGLRDKRIPPPELEISQDLLDRAAVSFLEVAEEYAHLGGVLIARRHLDVPGLANAMFSAWKEYRPRRVDRLGLRLPSPEEEEQEQNDRRTLAAQALRDHMGGFWSEPHDAFVIPVEHVEGLCVVGVREMERAYNDPDKFILDRARERVARELKAEEKKPDVR